MDEGKWRALLRDWLLTDAEIRGLVREIAQGGGKEPVRVEMKRPDAEKSFFPKSVSSKRDSADVSKWRDFGVWVGSLWQIETDNADVLKDQVKEKLKAMAGERERLRGELEDDARRISVLADEKETLERARQKAEKEISDLQNRLRDFEEKARSFEEAAEEAKREKDVLQNENKALSLDAEGLRKELREAQKTLSQRFGKGTALWEAYRRLSGDYLQRLEGVIRNPDDFESFICCLSQKEAMVQLWDLAKDAYKEKKDEESRVLYEVFAYAMELVNHTMAHPYYEILTVAKGDSSDIAKMELSAESRAQGAVQCVHVQGFWNTYNKQIIRKSVVTLL